MVELAKRRSATRPAVTRQVPARRRADRATAARRRRRRAPATESAVRGVDRARGTAAARPTSTPRPDRATSPSAAPEVAALRRPQPTTRAAAEAARDRASSSRAGCATSRTSPSPGILFKDVTPLLADGEAFARGRRATSADRRRGTVDVVVGIEARGFIFGAALAHELGHRLRAGPQGRQAARRRPRGVSYDLEYGSATIEIHEDAFVGGERVLVVDDVLATGGTAEATCELLERRRGRRWSRFEARDRARRSCTAASGSPAVTSHTTV